MERREFVGTTLLACVAALIPLPETSEGQFQKFMAGPRLHAAGIADFDHVCAEPISVWRAQSPVDPRV